MSIFNFFNHKKDESQQSDMTGTSRNQNLPGVCDTPLDSQYTPDRIITIGKRDIFVFGSNLAGRHGGGAARIAMNRFGAIYGRGEGLQGNSYAIPTMQGRVETIQPYVDRFIEFARREKALTFYVTKIGCGIAGFKAAEIAPLFAKAIVIPNIRLPKDFFDIISQGNKIDNIQKDLFVHAHGVTRTFADLVISRNNDEEFRNPGEVMSFLSQYFDRFRQTGDKVAFIAVRVFWNIINDETLFANGQLNVTALKDRLLGFESYSGKIDLAYEFHCREKLFNLVAYLNLFRRYRNAHELLRDIDQSGITRFSHCGPNCDYSMSPVRAGLGYPIFYFERFLNENWENLLNADGTLDSKKLDELMFNNHDRELKKYGLEATIARNYLDDAPCHPEVFFPKTIGTGPVYVKHYDGRFTRSCGEGKGPNRIPDYLGYEAVTEILKNDSRYESINGYFIPKHDITLPILGDWRDPWIKDFNNLEEKRNFINSLRRRSHGC